MGMGHHVAPYPYTLKLTKRGAQNRPDFYLA